MASTLDLSKYFTKDKIDKLTPTQLKVMDVIYRQNNTNESVAVQKMYTYNDSGKVDPPVLDQLSHDYEAAGPKLKSLYQHTSGTIVIVVANCVREVDFVPLVVYHHQGGSVVWSRPTDEFNAKFKLYQEVALKPSLPSMINDPATQILAQTIADLKAMDAQKDMPASWYQAQVKVMLNKLEG